MDRRRRQPAAPPADLDAFSARLAAGDAHVVGELPPDSRVLLVLFGGIAGGVSIPPFEFFRLTATLPIKKLFLRDPLRAWYQRGLPGVGDSVEAVARYLQDLVAAHPVDRIVTVGASAGGFAAILFGNLLGADEVHAFSPQTFIDATNRRRIADERWPEQIAALHQTLSETGPYYDLRNLLHETRSRTRYELHFGRDDALDSLHVAHLADLDNVVSRAYDGGGHQLVRVLRDRGELQPILRRALGLPES